MPPTLGAALLCSSRAGSDMWLLSGNLEHRDWGRTIGVCVFSFLVVVTQFSRDLETARFKPGAAGSQSAALPQCHHASVIQMVTVLD